MFCTLHTVKTPKCVKTLTKSSGLKAWVWRHVKKPAPLQTKRGSQQSRLHWKAILGGLTDGALSLTQNFPEGFDIPTDPIKIQSWRSVGLCSNTFRKFTKLIADACPYREEKHAAVQRASSSTKKIWWIRTGSCSQNFDYLLWHDAWTKCVRINCFLFGCVSCHVWPTCASSDIVNHAMSTSG